MKKTIQSIRESLSPYYGPSEIESFTALIFNCIFGYSRKEMILKSNHILPESGYQKVAMIVSRLKQHEPIQYILGETEFYGLKIKVEPGVLIPRFETEELVDLIIKREKGLNVKILDIGIGSGCIAISMKKNLPGSDVWGCDISDTALRVTRENAALNDVSLTLEKFDILGKETFRENRFDIIVSNPPYVTEKEKQVMQKNVLDFEPWLALFVPDNDPLIFYRAIVYQAKQILIPGGKLYFEINETYGNEISALMTGNGYTVEIIKDINGKERIALGKQNNRKFGKV